MMISGICQLTGCVISTFTAFGITTSSPVARVGISNTYISGGAFGIFGTNPSLFFSGTVINGSSTGINVVSCIQILAGTDHNIVQNASGTGIKLFGSALLVESYSFSKFILRGNGVGLYVSVGCNIQMSNWEITSNTSHGIQLIGSGLPPTGKNSFQCTSCIITGNGGDGIRVESSHNHIHFGGAGATISGNTGYGLRFGGAAAGYATASHNSAMLDSNVVMGTNTLGDITNDNASTTKTIAQARVDVEQVSATLFNRIEAV
jgi:hypothetical protein